MHRRLVFFFHLALLNRKSFVVCFKSFVAFEYWQLTEFFVWSKLLGGT